MKKKPGIIKNESFLAWDQACKEKFLRREWNNPATVPLNKYRPTFRFDILISDSICRTKIIFSALFQEKQPSHLTDTSLVACTCTTTHNKNAGRQGVQLVHTSRPAPERGGILPPPHTAQFNCWVNYQRLLVIAARQ